MSNKLTSFAKDLNDATEAWFSYADANFGAHEVEIDAGLLHPKHTGYRMIIRKDLETHRRALDAWTPFIDAFLIARGWTRDEKRSWKLSSDDNDDDRDAEASWAAASAIFEKCIALLDDTGKRLTELSQQMKDGL